MINKYNPLIWRYVFSPNERSCRDLFLKARVENITVTSATFISRVCVTYAAVKEFLLISFHLI